VRVRFSPDPPCRSDAIGRRACLKSRILWVRVPSSAPNNASVVELVFTLDLKSSAERHAGSSPATRTKNYADVMELVYVSVLEAEFCEFESHHPHQYVSLAQWIEQWSSTPQVGGSNPSRDAKFMSGWQSDRMRRIANPYPKGHRRFKSDPRFQKCVDLQSKLMYNNV